MPDFKIDEIVKLEDFPLVRVSDVSGVQEGDLGVVIDCIAGAFPLVIPLGVVRVVRVASGPWPPLPGDLWRDKYGDVWFATDVHDVEETHKPDVKLVRAYEGQTPMGLDTAVQLYGPFTLVHREEQGGASDA